MPTLTDFGPTITVNENTVNSTPQILDANVVFTDDEGDFDGGTLTVSGLLAEDRVSVFNQGTGVGQIGRSGANITYGGVIIGTLAGGVGGTMTITFNANATSAAIDALIQNLTYANVSNAPTASRDLVLNVTDAAGNDLVGPPVITVTVTAQNDAPTVVGGATVTLTAVAEDSADPAGATVADLFGPRFSDPDDGDQFAGIMIGINNANASHGVWQVFTGGVWTNLPALSPTNTFLVAASDSLRFLPAANYNGTPGGIVVLLIDSSEGPVVTGTRLDSSLTGSGGTTRYSNSTVSLTTSITSVEDAPSATGLPTDIAVSPNVASDLDLSAVTLTDPDTAGAITVTLTASAGTMTATSGGGVTVANSGTSEITLTGTVSAIDTFLNTASAIQYTSALNASGDNAATVTVTANDGSGAVELGVVNIDIAAGPTGPTPDPDTFTGTAGDDTLKGLGGDDVLDGGDGDDTLEGGDGDDDLTGGAGNDTLNGGQGADVMAGGLGDDTYWVNDAGDVVDETGGDGVDTVLSMISYTLTDGVENLTLLYAQPINGTGNGLNNVIIGNGGANVLSGLDGDDTISGGSGNDTLLGGDGDDSLDGGAGNDRLDGGTGADAMAGGAGADTYVVDDIGDTVTELAGGGNDTVEASISYALTDHVENLTLTGVASINGTGNGLNNVIIGNDGDNVLAGGGGSDTLTGGLGADTFLFTNADIGARLATDHIVDLNFAEGDVIDLSGIDANSLLGGDQAFSFVSKFTKVAGQAVVTFAGGVTTVSLDVDGDGKADHRIAITGDHRGTTDNLYTGGGDTDGGWVM